MGTLSKRRLQEFGIDVLHHVEEFRRKGVTLHPGGKVEIADHRPAAPKEAIPWLALAGVAVGLLVFAVHKLSNRD